MATIRIIDPGSTSGVITYASSLYVRDMMVQACRDLLSMTDTPDHIRYSDDEAFRRVWVAATGNLKDEQVPQVAVAAVPYAATPVGPSDMGCLDADENTVLAGIQTFKVEMRVRALKQDETEGIVAELQKYLSTAVVRNQISKVGIDVDIGKGINVNHRPPSPNRNSGTLEWVSTIDLTVATQWEWVRENIVGIDRSEAVTSEPTLIP